MYKAVIFDLDGTLLNTIDDLAAAGNYTLAQMGLPQHTTQEFMRFIGNGIPKLIRRMLPSDADEAAFQRAAALFDAYYSLHKQDATAPYPGIPPLLEHLRTAGVRMAVLSNKAHHLTVPIIRHYFGDVFDAVQGLEDGIPAKPAPAGANRLLEKLVLSPEEVLYVGDSDTDMRTAAAAGLTGCGVLWGFRSRETLLNGGAKLLVGDAAALEQLILCP